MERGGFSMAARASPPSPAGLSPPLNAPEASAGRARVGSDMRARSPSPSPSPSRYYNAAPATSGTPVRSPMASATSNSTGSARVMAPGHQHHAHYHGKRRAAAAWVPDSLAERCYQCRAAFSLVLRRHHCRRCGNVFCDTCSSARIPLVTAGFPMPVRVCQRCCVAARKAHAKMVEERQRRRLHSDSARFEDVARTGQSRLRSASSGSYNGSAKRAAANASSTVAMASALYFHQPFTRPRRDDRNGGHGHRDATLSDNYDEGVWYPLDDDHDQLSDDGTVPGGSRSRRSSSDPVGRLQTLPGEIVLVRTERVRIRLLEGVEHSGTLYVTTYRVVFSPLMDPSSQGVINDNTHTRWGVAAIPIREDELPYASDLRNAPLISYQAIPLLAIERAKKKETAETDRGVIDLTCKDFRRVQFQFDGLVSKQTFGAFDRTFQLIRQYALSEFTSNSTSSSDVSRSPVLIARKHPDHNLGGNGDDGNEYYCFAKYSREYFPPPPPARQLRGDSNDDWHDGWQLYNTAAELERMGVATSSSPSPHSSQAATSSCAWRISDSNKRYELCATYPYALAVPATVSDAVLMAAAKFRSKSRIPVLAWRDKRTGAVICRSSQPLVGLGQKQCDKDVFLIQAIAASNPSSSKMVIIDARPWKNAVAQKTVGRAGYELTEQYETRHATASLKFADMVASEQTALGMSVNGTSTADSDSDTVSGFGSSSPGGNARRRQDPAGDNSATNVGGRPLPSLLDAIDASLVLTECKLIFMGIENIHAMRKSYNKLLELCCPSPANPKASTSNEKWLEQLASTRWIEHISRILDSAVEIVRVIKEQRASVLIHCSDGWDRTAQLTGLAELMLDPFYRTIRGFQVLVEKEWCSFGHKFRERLGHRTRVKGSGNGGGTNGGAGGASSSSSTATSSAAASASAAISSTLSPSEVSPVFLQWIDCVWQLLVQFPCAFEFNERYLILVLDNLYSCRFGTFLYDSERERVREEARRPTVSLWTYLRTVDRAVIENPFYHRRSGQRGSRYPRKPVSVTATRQCFEVGSSRDIADLYPDIPSLSLDAVDDAVAASSNDDDDGALRIDPLVRRGLSVLPRPASFSSDSSSSSPSLFAFESTMAVASSPSNSRNGDAAEFDDVVDKLQVDLEDHTDSKNDNEETNSSSGSLRGSDDGHDAESTSDSLDEMLGEQSSARQYRLVRDLDAGFAYPQPIDRTSVASSLAVSSPPMAPRSWPMWTPTRRNSEAAAPPLSSPSSPPPLSPVLAAATRTNTSSALSPKRPSLTSLFTPITDREPLLSDGIAVAPDDEDDDVITPRCAVKSLRFWSRYYLRWDPTVSGAVRDAGVEIETAHCNLQRECDEMRMAAASLRRELCSERKRHEPSSSSTITDRRHSAPVARNGSAISAINRWGKRADGVEDSDRAVRVDAGGKAFGLQHEPQSSARADRAANDPGMMRPPIPSVVTTDIERGEREFASSSRRATIEAQIARLREQKEQRIAMVEKSFDAQIARLQRQHEAMDE